MNKFDVIIVGAGPAGIFAALELTLKDNVSVLILEKGPDIDKRKRSAESLMTGWGGAGAFSDGKLTLSTEIGGWLRQYISEEELAALIDYVDKRYVEFGAPKETYGANDEDLVELKNQAVKADLKLIPSRIRHMGTDNCPLILKKMREFLDSRVTIRTEHQVITLMAENGKITGVKTGSGQNYQADYVIVAPGREGSDWLTTEAGRLGLSTLSNQVDLGVRVEVPAVIAEPLTSKLYESKLIYYSKSFEDQVRTFCMCPNGQVAMERYDGVVTVNGHSYAKKKTENTNFALLVSTTFTEPFKEPIAYGRYIARLANLLGGSIILQRLGDLQAGRRSTPERIARSTVRPTLKEATPGDLSFVLPYRYIRDITEMLRAMDQLAPGIYSTNTLLYGVEVKFYSATLKLDKNLQSEIEGLYTIGDGAGLTRGLIQASVSGVIAARSILKQKNPAAT